LLTGLLLGGVLPVCAATGVGWRRQRKARIAAENKKAARVGLFFCVSLLIRGIIANAK
jgi:hypothetical protein